MVSPIVKPRVVEKINLRTENICETCTHFILTCTHQLPVTTIKAIYLHLPTNNQNISKEEHRNIIACSRYEFP